MSTQPTKISCGCLYGAAKAHLFGDFSKKQMMMICNKINACIPLHLLSEMLHGVALNKSWRFKLSQNVDDFYDFEQKSHRITDNIVD